MGGVQNILFSYEISYIGTKPALRGAHIRQTLASVIQFDVCLFFCLFISKLGRAPVRNITFKVITISY